MNHSIAGDATDFDSLNTIIKTGKYDTVINCIGILNQFAENNHALAALLNSYLPHFVAASANAVDAQVIHMSTDCVFSGARGQYTEDDFPDGTTFYDRSKALGELNDDKNITLRNSIVGPDINERGIGLMNWFMKQSGEINGFTGLCGQDRLRFNSLKRWKRRPRRGQPDYTTLFPTVTYQNMIYWDYSINICVETL